MNLVLGLFKALNDMLTAFFNACEIASRHSDEWLKKTKAEQQKNNPPE